MCSENRAGGAAAQPPFSIRANDIYTSVVLNRAARAQHRRGLRLWV